MRITFGKSTPEIIRGNPQIIEGLIRSGRVYYLANATDKIRENAELVKKFIQYNPSSLLYISNKLHSKNCQEFLFN